MNDVQLGLGLLSIGRQWGVRNVNPPTVDDSVNLVEYAYQRGIRFFDTAPSYGTSESILGKALSLPSIDTDKVFVATKAGEYWVPEDSSTRVSHKYDDIILGIEKSQKLLGKIDLLQLHKANASNILSNDVIKAFEMAKDFGVMHFGASISDLETARIACDSGLYKYLQFPLSRINQSLVDVFELISSAGMRAIINRPLGMGELAQTSDARHSITEAFRYITEHSFKGVILTGTGSPSHLDQNINSFGKSQ